MRQSHRAGEKVFVDYSGKKPHLIIDQRTGERRPAELFVGVLGASNLTYAEASWTQTLPDWIGSPIRLLDYFGGSPAIFVPDNLKSGVTRACRYEPEVNRTYQELARSQAPWSSRRGCEHLRTRRKPSWQCSWRRDGSWPFFATNTSSVYPSSIPPSAPGSISSITGQ